MIRDVIRIDEGNKLEPRTTDVSRRGKRLYGNLADTFSSFESTTARSGIRQNVSVIAVITIVRTIINCTI